MLESNWLLTAVYLLRYFAIVTPKLSCYQPSL